MNTPSEFHDNLAEMEDAEVEENDDLEPSEIFDQAMAAEDVFATDGTNGVRKLEHMAKMLGYDTLADLLADNSGMIEAMMDWQRDNLSPEQLERLESYIPEDTCAGCGEPLKNFMRDDGETLTEVHGCPDCDS